MTQQNPWEAAPTAAQPNPLRAQRRGRLVTLCILYGLGMGLFAVGMNASQVVETPNGPQPDISGEVFLGMLVLVGLGFYSARWIAEIINRVTGFWWLFRPGLFLVCMATAPFSVLIVILYLLIQYLRTPR